MKNLEWDSVLRHALSLYSMEAPGKVPGNRRPRSQENVATPWGVFGTIFLVITSLNPPNANKKMGLQDFNGSVGYCPII
jgi:hypothetical protein